MFTKRNVIIGCTALLGILLLTTLWGYIAIFKRTPDFAPMRASVEMRVKDAQGNPTTRRIGPQAPGWVAFEAISENLVHAVISQEDTAFFHHSGIDLHEIKEAIKQDLKEGRYARGASTITQQVVKNVFLSQEKSLWRKIKEIFWAGKLEEALSKKEILTFYLNMAEFGPGIYGIGQATNYYFGVAPSQISAKQGVFIAMLLPSPVKYHDNYFVKKELTPWAAKRMTRTLRVMHRMKFIDEAAYKEALVASLWGEAVEPVEEEDSLEELPESDDALDSPPVASDDKEGEPKAEEQEGDQPSKETEEGLGEESQKEAESNEDEIEPPILNTEPPAEPTPI